jgi:hypothetical protein
MVQFRTGEEGGQQVEQLLVFSLQPQPELTINSLLFSSATFPAFTISL